MTFFRFAHPVMFALFLFPLLAFVVPQLRTFLSREPASIRYSDTRLLANLPSSWRLRFRWLPDLLRALAWCLLIIVLARPQSGSQADVIRGRGIDVVLALDISSSMAALDFEPENRLQAAKHVISDFVSRREFDRIGLVVFARTAFHQAPLTLDYNILLQLLDQVQLAPELNSMDGRNLDGTAIGLGLAAAGNMLRSGGAASKVVILLTDGANNAGVSPIQAAAALEALGIRVYTIGMGKPGLVEIPDANGELITVESDLNETDLRSIAEIAQGLYFRAESLEGLQQVYERIDRLEQSDVERRIFIRWQDRSFGIIAAAILILILERILRLVVFRGLPGVV